MPNRLSQFWQEVKRRNVHRSLAVYAGTSFAILEASSLIFPRWGLPDLAVDLVLYLLIAGLFITLIVSWMYDVTPEGVQKTKPVSELKKGEVYATPNSWKIATFVSIVVIAGLIVLNVIPRLDKKELLDKSIAVLPFINESPELENDYLITSYRTAIHDNLCRIKELRVLSLESTEPDRDLRKSRPEMAKELGVGYLLSARGQLINNRIRLTVQLANAKDDILWSMPYDRQIELVEDHIDIQSDIAQLVAGEIQAAITPEEQELMGKIPTTSLSAYDLYARGVELFYDYRFDEGDPETLERAEHYYLEALRIDSSYALAYVGLADIVWEKTNMEEYFKDNFLDSVLTLVNLALSFDDQSCEAYTVRGGYYGEIGRRDLAIKDLETAIRLNPNHGRAYGVLAAFYSNFDFIRSAELFLKASNIDRGPYLADYLKSLGFLFHQAGFSDISFNYLQERLKLTGDSADYCFTMGAIGVLMYNYADGIEYSRKAVEYGATWSKVWLARALVLSGQPVEALEVYESWLIDIKEMGLLPFQIAHRIAYAYWINDLKEEAEYYFDRQIEYCKGLIENNRPWAQDYLAYYDLAAVYAFRGEKEKAYENLRKFNQAQEFRYPMVLLMKRDELFESIRNEPEFQQILQDIETKYQALHEQVRQWLEENDIL